MIAKSDAPFDEAGAFGFEQTSLKAGKRLADRDAAARGDHAVPGNGLTTRTSCHGSSGGSGSAGEPSGARQLAVGDDASFGNAPN